MITNCRKRGFNHLIKEGYISSSFCLSENDGLSPWAFTSSLLEKQHCFLVLLLLVGGEGGRVRAGW